jgi:plastocyanin
MWKSLLFAAALVIAVPAARAADGAITIDNFTFNPQTLTVPAGTKVVWTNRDDIPHVVADAQHPEAMKSQPLDTGDSFAFTFTKPGTYHYFCAIHPMMTGTVIVR